MREKSTKEYCTIFEKEKEKSTLNMKRVSSKIIKVVGLKKKKSGYVKVGTKGFVYL